MRIKLKAAQLYEPLFLKGNLGTKLVVANRTGLELELETTSDKVIVFFNGDGASVDYFSATAMNPNDLRESPQENAPTPVKEKPVVQKSHPMTANAPAKAQLESPMGTPAPISPQVENPTKPKQGLTGVEGKKKPLSRAEINPNETIYK